MDAPDYREISWLPGYRLGIDGSIQSCIGKGRTLENPSPWKDLRQSNRNMPKKYPSVRVRVNGIVKTLKVYWLTATAFHGPCPKGMQCRHLDGNSQNGAASNLKWGTRQENKDDEIRHETRARGDRTGGSKLNDEKVREIRKIYASGGISQNQLAKQYGITQATLGQVTRRVCWRHVV